jgi:hypothetical protein
MGCGQRYHPHRVFAAGQNEYFHSDAFYGCDLPASKTVWA